MKKILINTLYILLIITLLWTSISLIIQAFLCPDLTQTQLILKIPDSFICDWDYCNIKLPHEN